MKEILENARIGSHEFTVIISRDETSEITIMHPFAENTTDAHKKATEVLKTDFFKGEWRIYYIFRGRLKPEFDENVHISIHMI